MIISVNRALVAPYPKWVTAFREPELQHLGPAKFDPQKLEKMSCANPQDLHYISDVYKHLNQNGLLARCLTLLDGQAIIDQMRLVDFQATFQECVDLFDRRRIYLFGSAVSASNGQGYFLPFVDGSTDAPNLTLNWTQFGEFGDTPASWVLPCIRLHAA